MVYGLNVQPVYDNTSSGTPLDQGFQEPIPAFNSVNDGGTGWSGRNGGVPVDGTNFPIFGIAAGWLVLAAGMRGVAS